MKRKLLNKKRIAVLGSCAVLILALLTAVLWQGLTVSTYSVYSDKVDSGIRLCVITDHHASSYGKDQKKLVSAIEDQDPDVVLIIGDLFDEDRKTDNAEALLRAIGKKYTCYYTTGNHEYRTGRCEELKTLVRTYGVTVLDGDVIELTVNGQSIKICGIDDLFGFGDKTSESLLPFDNALGELYREAGEDSFSVLLSHRPQQADLYSKYKFDLVLSGHNHGGQVQIPFTGKGLFTPTDGFFPEYDGGEYSLSDDTVMIVSRGLCKDLLPRVFNPPELITVDILPQ
ncbi:MAG: metallophosphoesterase [Ruminococcaceae bacterium]|nr:metallophosphoesterase [Oscillospiraceae bacterium]